MSTRSFSGPTTRSFSGPATTSRSFAPSVAGPGFARDRDFRHHHHHRGPFIVGAPSVYADDSYAYDDSYDDSCTQVRQVLTPWGLQWQRVWVCN